MIVGYDSTDPAACPAGSPFGYYVAPSSYAWSEAALAAHTSPLRWSIATSGGVDADELDVESGAATLNDIPAFCRLSLASRSYCGIYCSSSVLGSAMGVVPAEYRARTVFRAAQYGRGGEIVAGCWATQVSSPKYPIAGYPGFYDVNFIGDPSWIMINRGIASVTPTVKPTVKESEDMFLLQHSGNVEIYLVTARGMVGIADMADEASIVAALGGRPVAVVGDTTFNNVKSLFGE